MPQFVFSEGEKEKSEKIILVFTGDNLLAGRMQGYIKKYGPDYPYEKVKDILQKADLAFGNLENPLTNYTKSTPAKSPTSIKAKKNFIFKSEPKQSAKIIKEAGFDILSLANNHMMDYCAQGLEDTILALKKEKIEFVGAGENFDKAVLPEIIDIKGIRVGFFASSLIRYSHFCATKDNPGINCFNEVFLIKAIESLKNKVGLIVVSLHWGKEGNYFPEEYQKKIARKLIEAGTDIIIGHHPHRIQGIEIYQGKVIAYSLGNFMFCGKSKNLESAILKIEVEEKKISDIKILPILIPDCQPNPTQNEKVIKKILEINQPFKTEFELKDSWLILTNPKF
jgi:poly-gamma-glutamate synthesis protein (capsule biosynthesis protein)